MNFHALALPPQVTADLAEAARFARRFMKLQRQHKAVARWREWANFGLACEWVALIGLTYLFVYANYPWYWKLLVLIPWSIASSLALSNIEHYASHWPLFRNETANALFRALGILVFLTPLEYRYPHRQHHQLNNSAEDPITTLESTTQHQSFWKFVVQHTVLYPWYSMPWAPVSATVEPLRRTQPRVYWEIIAVRWACLGWAIVLLLLDWRDTVFFMFPLALLVAPFASDTMSLTDHVPGDPDHPFRMATYLEPTRAWERFLCQVNHHTASTHLTHHLFPHIHWTLLPRLQRRLLKFYRKYDAPTSLICNSVLLGNPARLIAVLRRAEQRRQIEKTAGG